MKKQIVAMILVITTILMCSAFTSNVKANEGIEPVVKYITKTVEIEKSFKVEKLEKFEDPNLTTYTMEQLQVLIEAERSDQASAQALANSARELGWDEELDPIVSAGNEWWNSQMAIEVYHARYEELCVAEESKWAKKNAEYPAATYIWRYMKDLGWNDYVCAGIMGNLMAEVGG